MSVQTAVVIGVGSSAGLGAALARRFAKEGLRVSIAGRTAARLEAVANEIRDSGGSAQAVVADATREADVLSLLNEADERGTLELVAYNVGNNAMIPSLEISEAQFETMWRQNALGGFLAGREAVRRMLPRGSGTVLYTGATASLRAQTPLSCLCLGQGRPCALSPKAWRGNLARKEFMSPMWSSMASSAANMLKAGSRTSLRPRARTGCLRLTRSLTPTGPCTASHAAPGRMSWISGRLRSPSEATLMPHRTRDRASSLSTCREGAQFLSTLLR